jgi:mono/diheme cytochrome c family protein
MKAKKRKLIIRLVIVVVIIGAVVGVIGWYKLFRKVPTYYASADEHFKYGSVGAEEPSGVPYLIWLVLPRMFPEKLPGPGGYSSLGVAWEEGQELPIGFTKMTIGFPRVAVNCASCHTTTVRTTAKDKPMMFPGGPSSRFMPQAYLRFLFACATDPGFNPDSVLKEIDRIYKLSWLDRALYRYVVIPQFKKTVTRQQTEDYAWMNSRPDWGPGRTDMNPFQLVVMKLPDNHTIGSTDIMAIWNQRAHEGFLRHSDGLNSTLIEPVLSAALAAGATRDSLDVDGLKRVNQWLLDLPSARYPYSVDPNLASHGNEVYQRTCASCHAFGGARTGKIVPIEELQTDRHRMDHWPQSAADAFNKYAEKYPWGFHNFRSSNGYVSLPLDGVWARAPYLHNGSVPTLADLLAAVDQRPKLFWRGYDVYDQERVGFISSGAEAEASGFRYDTSVTGNSNQGHLWGSDLSAEDKKALIEFLKTL